jgi:hypothetical protein
MAGGKNRPGAPLGVVIAAPRDSRRLSQGKLEKRANTGTVFLMPLIKLNRINKGGEIVINSEHILFVEIDSRTTTIHMTGNLLFSVEEPLNAVVELAGATGSTQRGPGSSSEKPA